MQQLLYSVLSQQSMSSTPIANPNPSTLLSHSSSTPVPAPALSSHPPSYHSHNVPTGSAGNFSAQRGTHNGGRANHSVTNPNSISPPPTICISTIFCSQTICFKSYPFCLQSNPFYFSWCIYYLSSFSIISTQHHGVVICLSSACFRICTHLGTSSIYSIIIFDAGLLHLPPLCSFHRLQLPNLFLLGPFLHPLLLPRVLYRSASI